ncbi:hypothetical protein ABEB36_009808 [Hypothenemus hampei]|uniref:Uncharacterized protein n=1 Tax=Hypothenemus hampei TaxID=57062 RepID=A0ABD1EHY4_HYPHA
MDHYGKTLRKTNPREKANFLSRHTFTYTGGLFFKSFKRDLEEEDVYEVTETCKSQTNSDKFEKSWRELMSKNGKISLKALLWRNFGYRFLFLSCIQFAWKTTTSVYEPKAIGKLVSYFNPTSKLTFQDAFFYASLMIGLKFFHAIYVQNFQIYLQHLAINIRNSLCSLIYRKCKNIKSKYLQLQLIFVALKLSPMAMSEIGLGNVITVMTKDVVNFEKAVHTIMEMVIDVLRSILICYLIYDKMGIASFVGVGFLLLIFPFQVYISKCVKNIRADINKKTDERLQATQETLSAIKIIKMYAWEQVFVGKLQQKRKEEMRFLLKCVYLRSVTFLLGKISSKIGLYLLMITYIYLTKAAEAEVIFYVMRSYQDLRHSLSIMIPLGLAKFGELLACAHRIRNILNANEVDERNNTDTLKTPKVKASGVTVKIHEREILKDISTEVRPGLTVVTGPLGCGKSTLLKLFLNDIPIYEGKLQSNAKFSYCSQDSWLFPSSIKQNIIFGEQYDEARYNKVVKICALEYDFNLFKDGDETIVADGGKNLSGGQQTRVNLARAIYKKSDIYLLDDPLHSLDPTVQEFIYQNCIKDFLKDSRCVLVTHNLKYKNGADHVIVLEDGRIRFDGKASEIKQEVIKEILEKDQEITEYNKKHEEEEADEKSSLIKRISDKKKVYSEVKKVGKVDFSVIKKYFKFGGGFLMVFFIVFIFVIGESSDSYSSRVFTNWINLRQNLTNLESTNESLFNESYTLLNQSDLFDQLESKADMAIKQYSVLSISSFLLDLGTQFLLLNFARKAAVKLHSAMTSRLITACMSFFDTHFIGNVLNRFSQDLNVVDESLPMSFDAFLMVMLACFGAVALVTSVSYIFLIPAIILIIVLVLLRVLYMPTARSLKRLEAAARSPLIGHLNASIEGITTIRASQMEQVLSEEFDRHQDLYTSANYMTFCIRKAFAFFMDIISALFVTFIVLKLLFWGAGELSGDVGLAITKASMLAMMVQFTLMQWSDLENDMTHVERALEYTEVPQDKYDGQVMDHWPHIGEVIFSNVSLTYKMETVLKNVSFTVKPKHKIGIVGRTGAGKSSLVSALFRLYSYDGLITIDGINIQTLSLQFLRDRISIIPQDPLLFQGTIRYNLDPLNRYDDKEIWLTLKSVFMAEHIPHLNLEIADHGSNFSTGQRQLICLARAILKKNRIVVLDEATANMDPDTDFLVQKVIADNFYDCTVFVIAHRLQSVLECHRILVLERGKILEYGDPVELVENKQSFFSKMLESDDSFKK